MEGERRPKQGDFCQPLPATVRRGAAIRNNRISRPNFVTRRVAAGLTGVVTHGVRPNNNNNNNNNNNQAALTELFQPSTLHALRQLGLYTNTDTQDIEHQLDAEAVAAEVAYTMTNTQPSCLGEGESDRIPNTARRRQPHLQSSRKVHYAKVLFRAKAG